MRIAELRDWVYPTLEPPTPDEVLRNEEKENAQLAFAEAHPEPVALSGAYQKLYLEDMERLLSVQTRLGGILSLTSITASLLLGGMFALLSGGLSDSGSVRFAAGAAILYLNLQVVCSTIAVIRGMSRSTWDSPSVADLIPGPNTALNTFQRQAAVQSCQRVLTAEKNINYKVSQMAVAHIAVRNFATGSALAAALGLAALAFQHPGSAGAKAIRSDPEIQNLLRGPQGPPGPPGPKGDPAQPGPCEPRGKPQRPAIPQ